jgi:hypothetical protein
VVLLVVSSFIPLIQGCRSTPPSLHGVQITQRDDRLEIDLNGKRFTDYFFKDVPRPYYYPVMGPGDLPMTRDWPMKSPPNEEHDHPHHRSLWFAHGSVNGIDFWSETRNFGKIVHESFSKIQSGSKVGVIKSTDSWMSPAGKRVCSDERTIRIFAPEPDDSRILDFEITLKATDGDVVFGDTKEGTMACRLAETMRLKGKTGHGHIINSGGIRDDETWGKRAEWCDYYGPVNGQTVGVAIFDHPDNPRHPTWWHVRDYGLFAANPFGRHDFEKLKDPAAGNFTIPAGKSATFRYRFYFHPGDDQTARVAQKFRQYIKPHP